MSNLSALKQILTVLGGTPAASDSNDETIAKTATALGTKEFLPSVTSADKGKVPTVSNDGEWELATPSGGGGGGAFIVNIGEVIGSDVVLNKTWKEIYDASLVGSVILVVASEVDVQHYYISIISEDGAYEVDFFMSEQDGTTSVLRFSCEGENEYPVMSHGG